MNGLIPETIAEFEQVCFEAQPHSVNRNAVNGAVRCVFKLLGALTDAEILETVRNCDGKHRQRN